MKLNGEMIYLWRAVDKEGETLESFVSRLVTSVPRPPSRRTRLSAIITDGLRSYGAAMNELGNRDKQEIGGGSAY